jgi:membrane protein implicated in regulation of membrane protease activity
LPSFLVSGISGANVLKPKSARWHTVYSIISTIIEEAGIAVLLLWILPVFNINLPLWATITVLVAFAIFSYVSYRLGHPTVLLEGVTSPETIVGSEGVVQQDLAPEGYVQVRGELWKASSTGGSIKKGDEVIITGIEGLKLTVIRKQV